MTTLNRIRTIRTLPDGSQIKVNEALDGSDRIYMLYRPVESLLPNENMQAIRGFRRAGTGLEKVEAVKGRRVNAKRGGGGVAMDDGEEIEAGTLVLAREMTEEEALAGEGPQGGGGPPGRGGGRP